MNDYRVQVERRFSFNGGTDVEVQQDHMEAETAQEVADQMRKDWPERDGWYIRRISMVVRDWK